ncbi:MAG: DMT family transporter [Capsulimonadales bacterium]|nr:DMT family transporter [Capsulimonadales bacterium]
MRFLPVIVLLGAQVAIGSSALMARVALDNGMSPLSLAGWRLLIAALIVLAARGARSVFRKQAKPSDTDGAEPMTAAEYARLTLAGIGLAVHFLAWFASLTFIPVARSTLLVTTSPIWSGLAGALWLKQRPGPGFIGGLGLACVGAWGVTLFGRPRPAAMAGASEGIGDATMPVGDALALVGAVALAAYFLLVDGVQKRHGTERTVAITYTAAAATLWAAIPLLMEPAQIRPVNPPAWLAVLGMALLPQLIGHTSLNWCLLHFKVGVVGVAMLLEPVVAGILAFFLLAEPVTAGQGAAAIVLLFGVALTLRSGDKAGT